MATFDISKERIVTLKYYLSLRLERVEALKYRCVCRPRSEKFNIVSYDQAIFAFQLVKPILRTVPHLMQ